MKKIKDKKLICIISVILGLSLILIISILLLVKELNQYKESSQVYTTLEELVVNKNVLEACNEDGIKENNIETSKNKISKDFDKLKEEAPDVIGWITQENTNINYPIMHTDNNDYYLNHLYNGIKNKSGSIYMDYENATDFNDYNTIIYGHNMNDGAMFASLLNYKNQEYFDTNKIINLILPNANYNIEIFSAFVANIEEVETEKSPWNIKWENYEKYSEWLNNMQKRSTVKTDTIVGPGDKVVTLSTCTNNGKNSRFIVMGKLVYLNEN